MFFFIQKVLLVFGGLNIRYHIQYYYIYLYKKVGKKPGNERGTCEPYKKATY